jgi:hypothetical protein
LIAAEKAQTDSLENLKKATDKVSGNDFVHLNLAIDEATMKLLNFAGAFPGGAGAAGGGVLGGRYGGSNQGLTEYGHVPGDQPGGPTWDPDSWAGIGHIHGKAYNLNSPGPGAIAMHPEYAARMYPGLKPGGTFHSKKTGEDQRWLDTTGGGPNNEDRYHPPQTSVHFHINALDATGVHEVLRNHIDAIAEAINRHSQQKL